MIVRTVVCMMALALASGAQQAPFRYRGYGFGEANVGACVHGYFFGGGGGGGEMLVWKGLAVGGLASVNSFSDYGPIGIGQGTVGYHFGDRTREKGADSFISYGMGFASVGTGSNRSGPSASFGGGVNYWLNRKVALRMGGRMIGLSGDAIAVFHIGVAFR